MYRAVCSAIGKKYTELKRQNSVLYPLHDVLQQRGQTVQFLQSVWFFWEAIPFVCLSLRYTRCIVVFVCVSLGTDGGLMWDSSSSPTLPNQPEGWNVLCCQRSAPRGKGKDPQRIVLSGSVRRP